MPDPDNIRNLDWYRERAEQRRQRESRNIRFSTNQVVAVVVGLSLLAASIIALTIIILIF